MKLAIFSTKRQAIEKAKSTVLTSVVIASIVVSFSIVTVNFLWDLRGYNSRVIKEKNLAKVTLRQNLINADELTAQFSVFEASGVKSSEILDALPSTYDYAALVTSVNSIAKRSGLELTGFAGTDQSNEAPGTAVTPSPFEMAFSISVAGSYDSLKKFVDNLDRSIRPFQVRALSISGTDQAITADIAISTYFQPKADIGTETKVVQ
ncbi:MAG TPA: type 4a pilus biogenesis protein PilO [Candidatus Saccharimonadales bacterium]